MINGPREVVVSIAGPDAAWAWVVPAGADMTLLDERLAKPGSIEILDHSLGGLPCALLDSGLFEALSIVIHLDGPAAGPGYSMTLEPRPYTPGQPNVDYTADCSG